MKKTKLLLYLLIGLIIFSCSSDENSQLENNQPIISKWIKKNYSFSDGNEILTDSIEYILSNNKIVSFSGLIDVNYISKDVLGNIIYSNNKISQIEYYRDNQLANKYYFTYDDSEELIEFIYQYWDSNNQNFKYIKSEYTHTTTDTIYTNYYSGSDDIPLELGSTAKIVLDPNLNRILYEFTSLNNPNNPRTITANYDSQNNMNSFNKFDGLVIYNYTHSSLINSETIILNNTFGKKVNMMTIDDYSYFEREISKNAIETISQTWSNSTSIHEYEIENIPNQDNYTIRTLKKEFINGNSSYQEISEYIFE